MREYFNCAMDIGEQMLICGAEVHRVEDSMERMCSALGALRTDVFIITSSMVVTVHTADGVLTQTRRITGIGTDIEQLHRLNALSRKICAVKMTAQEITADFNEIKNSKKYPFWIEVVSYIVIAGSFTLFFGGGMIEALVSMIIGGVLRFLVHFSDKAELNKIFSKFICSLVVSFAAFAATKIGLISDIDNIIIGNIMLLIPGVGLTNALRDLLTGDSIAGLLRIIEAVLTALAIAAGYFLFICLIGGSTI
ncbi:MAG: threonine/serine exporter family protein [Clostridia bacterium]|nr:threonine/serine exporter family protein [Clostridia bacterium]